MGRHIISCPASYQQDLTSFLVCLPRSLSCPPAHRLSGGSSLLPPLHRGTFPSPLMPGAWLRGAYKSYLLLWCLSNYFTSRVQLLLKGNLGAMLRSEKFLFLITSIFSHFLLWYCQGHSEKKIFGCPPSQCFPILGGIQDKWKLMGSDTEFPERLRGLNKNQG